MSARTRVSFDSAYLAGLDDTLTHSHDLTDRQQALLLQCLLLLTSRRLWQDMTDNDWQQLYYEISAALEAIQT